MRYPIINNDKYLYPYCNCHCYIGTILHMDFNKNICDKPKNILNGLPCISLSNVITPDGDHYLGTDVVIGAKIKVYLLAKGSCVILRTDNKVKVGQKLYYCQEGKVWTYKEINNRFLKYLGVAINQSDDDGYTPIRIDI